jgi:hypothetical protein
LGLYKDTLGFEVIKVEKSYCALSFLCPVPLSEHYADRIIYLRSLTDADGEVSLLSLYAVAIAILTLHFAFLLPCTQDAYSMQLKL